MTAATPAAKPKRTRVAIIGFTPSRDLAPYQNQDYEIWALNDLFEAIPRCDRLFQIHSRRDIDTHTTRGEKATYIERLRKLDMPIYMIEQYDDIPNSVAYPLETMIAEFGSYFTNTISYMIALAIYEGFKEIHVYGVDMAVGTEFAHQRPSCEYFLGIAKGRGIRLYLPPQSDLLKSRFLYGFEQDKEEAFNAKCADSVKMMTGRMETARKQERELLDAVKMYEGGMHTARELLKIPELSVEATNKMQAATQNMESDRQKRLDQARQVREVINKYEGATQAISEIRRTWATCLDHRGLIDPVGDPQPE